MNLVDAFVKIHIGFHFQPIMTEDFRKALITRCHLSQINVSNGTRFSLLKSKDKWLYRLNSSTVECYTNGHLAFKQRRIDSWTSRIGTVESIHPLATYDISGSNILQEEIVPPEVLLKKNPLASRSHRRDWLWSNQIMGMEAWGKKCVTKSRHPAH